MSTEEDTPTRVGIGLVGRAGSYLIRRRPEGQTMSGRWEFPGGKCEPGESPEVATARECLEEIGVEVEVGGLVRRVVHRYPHGLIELNFYRGSTRCEPLADSGFIWVPAGELASYDFPGANDEVVALLAREAADPAASPRDE